MGGRWAAPDAGCTGHRSSWVGSVPSGCRAPAPRAGGPGALRAHFPPSRRERSPRLRAGVQPPTCCFGGQGPDGGRGVAPAGSVLSTPGKNARGRKKLNPLQCLRGAKGRTSVCGDANPRGERGAGERVRDQAGRWGPRQRQCGRSLAQRGLPLTLRGADVLPQHFSSYPVNKGIRRSQLTYEVPAGSRPPPAAEGSITPCSHRWSWQAQPWSGCDDLSWEAQRPPLFWEQPSSGPRGTEPAATSPRVQWGAMGTVRAARDVATMACTRGHPEIPTNTRAATRSLSLSTAPPAEPRDRAAGLDRGHSEELATEWPMGISQGVLDTSPSRPWHIVQARQPGSAAPQALNLCPPGAWCSGRSKGTMSTEPGVVVRE